MWICIWYLTSACRFSKFPLGMATHRTVISYECLWFLGGGWSSVWRRDYSQPLLREVLDAIYRAQKWKEGIFTCCCQSCLRKSAERTPWKVWCIDLVLFIFILILILPGSKFTVNHVPPHNPFFFFSFFLGGGGGAGGGGRGGLTL